MVVGLKSATTSGDIIPPAMKDMTRGPILGHILGMAAFIALSTMFQTLYLLVDLYFVGRLGKEAIAGVGMAGDLTVHASRVVKLD